MKGLIIAGYGGHAGYSYAVAYELARKGVKLDVLLPKGYDYLAKRFEKLGEVQYMTLPRKPLEPLHKGLHRWLKAFIESLRLLSREYDFVFSGGSNFSVPASYTLKLLKHIKLYTVEAADHVYTKSKAVNALSKIRAVVFLQWEEQRKMYPEGILVGPVYEPAIYEPWDGGYVLVTTGTTGAKELFDAFIELDVEKAVVKTSNVNPEPYIKRKPNWVFYKYVEDMDKLIAGASVVVTHPGVTALTARLAYGKPVVVVYTETHAKQFTLSEVKVFAEKINAVFLEKVNPRKLEDSILKARKLSKPVYPNGAVEIARILASQ
ncbi:MAG: UDP-N-acetylglucosamine--N-acetylmuramyl-(pentapeptide) pyrophosphoryl-undecaprenol N-acetylglucosamine transferase [Desulfurococcaceae archaeon]